MMYAKKITVVSLVSLMACLAGQAVLGNGKHVQAPAQIQEFKLIPRVNVWGFGGDYSRGEGQVLFPVWGNADRAFYVLGEGNTRINHNDWMGGAGLGYRQVMGQNIFGGYVIGNYINSTKNNGFWYATPGLEMLGQVWDLNVNGYIPFKQRKSIDTVEGIASQDLGITTFERFSGHKAFDHEIRMLIGEEAGTGIDAEIGRVIPRVENLRVYLGGYHFDADDADSINGVEARATYELNRFFALEGAYNYDNEHHSAAVIGLRFTFLGGYSVDEKKRYGISTRLLEPIEHDMVTGYSGIAAIEEVQKIDDLGEITIHDNIQFFKPLVTSTISAANDIGPKQGDGTFENPFIGFTPANVSSIPETLGPIDKHPLLYFAPGEYSFVGFSVTRPSPTGIVNDRFNLPNGWGMFGRTVDYKMPAAGSNRARFTGGLDLNYDVGKGGDQTTLDSVQIFNNEPYASTPTSATVETLFINNAQSVVLQNDDLQSSAISINGLAFATTISISNGSAVNLLDGNSISAIARGGAEVDVTSALVTATALRATNKSIINIGNNNYISAVGTAGAALSPSGFFWLSIGNSDGILASNFSQINVNGNNNTITASGTGGTAVGTLGALATGSASSLSASLNSQININGSNNNFSARAHDGTAISSTASIFEGGAATGLSATGSSQITVTGNHNNIFAQADGGTATGASFVTDNPTAIGIDSLFSSLVNFNGSNNNITAISRGGIAGGGTNVTSTDAEARGLRSVLGSVINFNGNNNTIAVTAVGGTSNGSIASGESRASGFARGFFVEQNSIVNIGDLAENTSITATARSGTASGFSPTAIGEADGLAASPTGPDASIINLSSLSTTNITVDGNTTSTGISILQATQALQIDGVTVADLNVFNTNGLITFLKQGVGGVKIQANSMVLPW